MSKTVILVSLLVCCSLASPISQSIKREITDVDPKFSLSDVLYDLTGAVLNYFFESNFDNMRESLMTSGKRGINTGYENLAEELQKALEKVGENLKENCDILVEGQSVCNLFGKSNSTQLNKRLVITTVITAAAIRAVVNQLVGTGWDSLIDGKR